MLQSLFAILKLLYRNLGIINNNSYIRNHYIVKLLELSLQAI